MSNIHKTAIIEDGAILGENVTVGAYTIIGKDVKIGDGTVIDSHTVIAGKTTIGKNNHIFSHASIALSSRLENKTTISDTSNGSVDRSFSLKSMSIPFRIASVAFVLNSASKIE